ncbi:MULTISPECIES: hypothetical protein [Streptacidiphilus]|uniref:Uncharacterized protein n=1 Tax=Streptacidiphilus cavernicola TaxID=3342716 RepID=A0ABV6UM03_9ACTN|nr:hypothetical protein [Streptacidiphilus jeojiense]
MTTSTGPDIDNDPYRLAIVAAERLRAALSAHGLTIPSLRGSYPSRDVPFVELGGCSAEVADALATALEKVVEA